MQVLHHDTRDVNKVIVESSIVFVSIFATIGLLIGASIGQFKTSYFYLGYMLYFSLPFILACSFGLVAMLSESENSPVAKVISLAGVSFFVTGLIMLVFLASSAAQTSILPTTFVFLLPPVSIPSLEILVFVVVLATLSLGLYVIMNSSKIWGQRDLLAAIFLVLFIFGVIMMTLGISQGTHVAASKTIFLNMSSPTSSMYNVSFPLIVSDQLQVTMSSLENQQFNYVFLDQANFLLYNNSATRDTAVQLESGLTAANYSFTYVVPASTEYYLVLQAQFVATNVTVYAQYTRPNTLWANIGLFLAPFSLSALIATSMARQTFRSPALVLPNNKQKRRGWSSISHYF